MIGFAQFSADNRVNTRFLELIASMASNPYEPATYGDLTLIEIIDSIRREFGEMGARSVRVRFH